MRSDVNEQKQLWTGKEKNTLIYVSGSIAVIFIVAGIWILPENCLLYEYRQVNFICDAFEFGKPLEPCPICSNETVATVARMFVVFGIIFLLVPAIVYGVRRRAQNMTSDDDQVSLGLDSKTNEQSGNHHGIGSEK